MHSPFSDLCQRSIFPFFQAENPGIEDMGPTCLDLFGFDTPPFMDRKSIGVTV
jgi:hypothetical protein